MQALQFDYSTKQITLRENICIPKIQNAYDVLVKVVYSGVCGTDLHICEGEYMAQEKFPVILGHEFCGEVVEVGKDVTSVEVGDKVVVDPNRGCGVCKFCQDGHPNYCIAGFEANTIGIYRNGGWANFCVIPVEQIIKMPPTITFEEAALAEPLSCITHAFDLISPIGDKVLILGCGIAGNLFACVLHSKGFRNVTIVDLIEQRMKIFERLNTGFHIIHLDRLKRDMETNYDPFDCVIDCTGNVDAIETGLSYLEKGGKFCQYGVGSPNDKFSLKPYDIFSKEIRIYGTKTNPYALPKALNIIESLGSRYLNYESLGIRIYKLANYNCAIEELKKKTITKVMFKLD